MVTVNRLLADRRTGTDRRATPRRHSIAGALAERRRVVDRRRGAERRSTLDRRGRSGRTAAQETPGEHVRNALQLLRVVAESEELGAGSREDVAAAAERLGRALNLLERRP